MVRRSLDGFVRTNEISLMTAVKKKKEMKKFSVKSRRVIFSKGPIHLVDCDVQMPSGRCLSRQIIEHPGAVVIIPQIGPDRFVLIRQFRFAVREWLWEWPAGGVNPGESLRLAAKRELSEEAGYWPRRLRRLISFYPTPGISSEIMHLFLARDLILRKAQGDEDEEIEVGEFTKGQIRRMIRDRQICDGKTLLGFWML